MSVGDVVYRARNCSVWPNKLSHDTRKDAVEAAAYLWFKTKEKVLPYQCRTGHWHIGRPR